MPFSQKVNVTGAISIPDARGDAAGEPGQDGVMTAKQAAKLAALDGAQSFSPYSYGAKGDGSADDAPAFRRMWAAIIAGGGSARVAMADPASGVPGRFFLGSAAGASFGAVPGRLVIEADGATLLCGAFAGVAMSLAWLPGTLASVIVRGLAIAPADSLDPGASAGLEIVGAGAVRFAACGADDVPFAAFAATACQATVASESTWDAAARGAGAAFISAVCDAGTGVDVVRIERCISQGGAPGARFMAIQNAAMIELDNNVVADDGETTILDGIDASNFAVDVHDEGGNNFADSITTCGASAVTFRSQSNRYSRLWTVVANAPGSKDLIILDPVNPGSVSIAPTTASALDIIGIATTALGGGATRLIGVGTNQGPTPIGARSDGTTTINAGDRLKPSTTVAGHVMKASGTEPFIGYATANTHATLNAGVNMIFAPSFAA